MSFWAHQVEESFNIQAVYDLLYKEWSSVSTFDHVEFPGVVPRTFIGPLVLTPLPLLVKSLFDVSPFVILHIARGTLGLLTALSLYAIRTSLSLRFGPGASLFFTILTMTQFHLLFYASRTLPNIFALILMNFAFADRLRPPSNHRPYRAIVIMSVACALFRSELCLYIFTTLITEVALGNIEIRRSMAYGLSAAVATALASIAVDSYFWRRPCYPELEVFYFNVVLNKSSAWGTHPFHWYFTNALPRALGLNYIVGLLATYSHFKTLAPLVIPAITFVCMYSVLPHKELRFIFYVLPVFNAIAAAGMFYARRLLSELLRYSDKKEDDGPDARKRKLRSTRNYLRAIICIGTCLCGCAGLFASLVQTVISTEASIANYPSARAIRAMHRIEQVTYSRPYLREFLSSADQAPNISRLCEPGSTQIAKVHIDVKSATNGISQFLQIANKTGCPQWTYSKREDVDNIQWNAFTHLISERERVKGFCIIHVEKGFAGIDWRQRRFRMEPHTFVHRNVGVSKLHCQHIYGYNVGYDR